MTSKVPATPVWQKDLNTAPKDKVLLVEHPDWECGALVVWYSFEDQSCWSYCENLISEVAGAIESDLDQFWWTLYPTRKP